MSELIDSNPEFLLTARFQMPDSVIEDTSMFTRGAIIFFCPSTVILEALQVITIKLKYPIIKALIGAPDTS